MLERIGRIPRIRSRDTGLFGSVWKDGALYACWPVNIPVQILWTTPNRYPSQPVMKRHKKRMTDKQAKARLSLPEPSKINSHSTQQHEDR
jgi:hypothetical protein